jgi:hypothetical protein
MTTLMVLLILAFLLIAFALHKKKFVRASIKLASMGFFLEAGDNEDDSKSAPIERPLSK